MHMSENPNPRAKEIIEKVIYITIATASKDNQPWNTPVYSAYDQEYNFYWASDKNGQHSKNVRENQNTFVVIYDSTVPEGTGEGVYMKDNAFELTDSSEIREALARLYTRKGQNPAKHLPDEFLGEFPRRVYKFVPEKFWMNGEGEVNGNYIDTRIEVSLLNK